MNKNTPAPDVPPCFEPMLCTTVRGHTKICQASQQGWLARAASESEVVVRAKALLRKFHKETDCGNPYHWHECEMLEDALAQPVEEKP